MRRHTFLLSIGLLTFQPSYALQEIGQRFDSPCSKVISVAPLSRVLVSPSASLPSKLFKENGQSFVLGFDVLNRVAYIETADPNFRAPEGIGVGSTLKELDLAGALPAVLEAGWAHYIELPSGWSGVFENGHSAPSLTISQKGKALWLFKRSNSLIHDAFEKTRPGYLAKNPGDTQPKCTPGSST